MVRPGRPPAITREQLSTIAVELFLSDGFFETTVADIAAAAGIAQRTFFLYFASKAEAFWFESERAFADVEEQLAAAGEGGDPLEILIALAALGDVWRSHDRARTRVRYRLVDTTPELQSASVGFHRRWVEAVETFLRRRAVGADDDWLPAIIAATMLAVGNTVTREWAFVDGEEALSPALERYLRAAIEGLLHN